MGMTLAAALLLQATAAEAIAKTRGETSYEAAFDLSLRIPGSDAYARKGTGRRCGPGVVVVEFQQAGDRNRTRAVRAGDRTWVHSPLHGKWMSPEEASEVGVLHGLQNPDVLLRVLADEAGKAKPKGAGFAIDLAGPEAVALVRRLAPNQDVAEATVRLVLTPDGAGRVGAVAVDVAVNTPQGAGRLKADVALSSFGQAPVPAALGPAGDPVPLSAEMLKAIDDQLRR